MPEDRMKKALEQLKSVSEADYAKVKALAAIVKPLRSFLHKTPDDHGMIGWSDVVIPSEDSTPLEGWYIPAKGGESDKLIIFNHALPMCRSGFPGHFGDPWSNYLWLLVHRGIVRGVRNEPVRNLACGLNWPY
jgi:hypothetical protein